MLVAVSGGPDSLSLLHVLWSEREARGLATVEAAHLDHGLRGDESAGEAAWVAAWCAAHGIPCHIGQADVATLAQEGKKSKQEAARAARYGFLAKTAAQTGATKIATGHTRDDQVETVLMNILRGTGLDGLRGIPARRGMYVRPLLDVSRAEIEDYCVAHRLEPRRDPSNLSPDAYTRNRVRLELLPLLKRDYNPVVERALLRLSDTAAGEWDYLHVQTQATLAAAIFLLQPGKLGINRAALAELHPALLRRVLRAAVTQVRGTTQGVSYQHMERLCRLMERPAKSGAITMRGLFSRPACDVTISQSALTLMSPPTSPPGFVQQSLPVGETIHLPEIGWQIKATFEPLRGAPAAQADIDKVDLNSLYVRNYRQGDQIDPRGMGGQHKKISAIFSDAKVPRTERHCIPIIADKTGIVWIAGHCLAERVKVTPETQRRLYLAAYQEPVIESREGDSAKGGE